MKYIQIGELGKAVIATNKAALPTAGILFLNKFYITADTNYIYTCKQEGSGYTWKQVTILPALTNGLANSNQLLENVEAIDANGNKITGTLKLVEKVIDANGVYIPGEDNAQGYSKITVNVAGESTENPYIATTKAEMNAYLAAEYAGSFVKYKTPLYFNQANNVPLSCKSKTELTGAIDTGLGQEYVNVKIDEWLPDVGMVKIASVETFNHDTTFQGLAQNYSVRETWDIYAWKYKNTDGSYTRVLFYAQAQTWAFVYTPDASTTWTNNAVGAIAFYQDNMTTEANTALGQLSISVTVGDYTGTTSVVAIPAAYQDYLKLGFFSAAIPNSNNYTDYIGKYLDGGGLIAGVAQLSWATYKQVYWNSVAYPRCTYLYKDASVLLAGIQTSSSTQSYKMESEKTYRDGFVYIVNSKKATRNKWQAESPLVQGDALAGATLYFNQQITYKEYYELCANLIPESQYGNNIYYFYNIDNPYEDVPDYATTFPLITIRDGEDFLVCFLLGESGAYTLFGENEDASTITSASIIVPTTVEIESNTITVPATIGKVNIPDVTNAVIGKTANFTSTIEEYLVYYFTQEVVPGNLFTESTEAKMDALLTEPALNNETAVNRVYQYTGESGKYIQGALYILTED